MKANRINFEMSAATLKEVIDAIELAAAKLKPVLLTDITKSDLDGYARLGDSSFSFVTAVLEHANANENLVPRFQSLEDAIADKKYYEALRDVCNRLEKLTSSVTMNRDLAGVELLDFSNDVYNTAKRLYQSGDPDVLTVFPALRARYIRPRRKVSA